MVYSAVSLAVGLAVPFLLCSPRAPLAATGYDYLIPGYLPPLSYPNPPGTEKRQSNPMQPGLSGKP